MLTNKLIFDYDDAIFSSSTGKPAKKRLKAFERITALSDIAVAGNSYLSNQSRAKQNAVIPTTVVLNDYPSITEIEQVNQSKTSQSELTLVWIGSRSTRKYLEHHRDVLEAIGQAFPQAKLRIIADFDLEFKHLKTECIAWSAATEKQWLLSADVGIAPMTNDPWTLGKCALKVIQYMACGLPVISSDVGANAEVIVNCTDETDASQATGYLVQTKQGWLSAIEQLADSRHRQALGHAGRKRVEQHYSAESAVMLWDKLFKAN